MEHENDMSMNFDVMLDTANFVLALILALAMLSVVLRTEKGIDMAFKFVFAGAMVFVVATAIELNRHVLLFSENFSEWVFAGSRFFVLCFFVVGSLLILRVIKKETSDTGKRK